MMPTTARKLKPHLTTLDTSPFSQCFTGRARTAAPSNQNTHTRKASAQPTSIRKHTEAYRIIHFHPDDRHLLCIYGDGQVYVDAALPFGLRGAPLISTALADRLQWVLQQWGTSFISQCLDDFITLGPPGSSQCAENQSIIYKTCTELGVPLESHKCVCPSTCLDFLGIEINTIAIELRLPQEKLSKIKELLSEWQFKKICSRGKLESLLATSIIHEV